MAKKNRSEVEDQPESTGRFQVSAKRILKEEMVVVTMSLSEAHNLHLARVAERNGTSRAEFVRQCVVFCLSEMGEPFPKGELSEEDLAEIEERKSRRKSKGEDSD